MELQNQNQNSLWHLTVRLRTRRPAGCRREGSQAPQGTTASRDEMAETGEMASKGKRGIQVRASSFRFLFLSTREQGLRVPSCDRVFAGAKGEPGDKGADGERGFPGFPGVPGQKGEGVGGAQAPRSAFSMGLTSRVTTANVPIRFNKLFYNEEGHYDVASGKFRCVIPGVYYFTYHLTIYPKDTRVSLYKNDRAIMFTFDQFEENNLDQASGSIILRLEVGDLVQLQVYGEEKHGEIYADNTNDSTFSGFLLYPGAPTTGQRR